MPRFRHALALLLACAVLAAPGAHAAVSATTLKLVNGWTGAPQFTALPAVSIESDIVRAHRDYHRLDQGACSRILAGE